MPHARAQHIDDAPFGDLPLEASQELRSLRAFRFEVRGFGERTPSRSGACPSLASAGSALPKLDEGMDRFVSIGRKIDEGEGTLGKMVNDPELYDNVRDAVAQIRRTFEEGEEQTVMRTFLSVFFGSVI